jgi:Glycosyltransferases, probably involved in cell wall biogenesis
VGFDARLPEEGRQGGLDSGLDDQRGMNLVTAGGLTPGERAYDALEPADRGGRKHVENGRQLASSESERLNLVRMYIGAGEDHNDRAADADRRVTPAAGARVTVIIPCYNHGRFLTDAIDSVLRQTWPDLELIVVDDGSTDDTAAVVGRVTDARVRLLRTAHRGVSAARNAGLEEARGELIAFLDADDIWEPTKLERQVALMDAEPDVALVFTDLRRYSADGRVEERQFNFVPQLAGIPSRPAGAGGGRVVVGDPFIELGTLAQLPAWIQTNLVRASAVRDLRFREELRLAEDLHYIMRCYTRGLAAYIDEPLVHVRRHEGNSYRGHGDMLVPVIEALRLLATEPLSQEHRRALSLRLSRGWLELGFHHYWNGNPITSATAYARAAASPDLRRNAILHVLTTPLASVLRYCVPNRRSA